MISLDYLSLIYLYKIVHNGAKPLGTFEHPVQTYVKQILFSAFNV